MRFFRNLWRCGFPRPNCPNGLIRNDNPGKFLRRERADAALKLLAQDALGLSALAFTQPFAHADDRVQLRFQRCFRFAGDIFFRFIEVLTAFAMRDDHVRAAHRMNHRAGDFARNRALLAPVQVLRADPDGRTARFRDSGFKVRKWRAQHDLAILRPGYQR